MNYSTAGLALTGIFFLTGCSGPLQKPISTVDYVNIERFMGDWYVIASIPTYIEREAYNAVETYQLTADDKVATTFTFRKGGFDGEQKQYNPTGFIQDTVSNAVWGMQFIWPIKADYRIVYLNEDYTQTVIGRNKRDYVWIMARSSQIPENDYQRLLELLEQEGYDVNKLRMVPQSWPDKI